MGYRHIEPKQIFSASVTGTGPVQTSFFDMRTMNQCSFLVSVGSGLTATFQVLVSFDGVNFYDSGMVLPGSSGSALTFPVEGPSAYPYVRMQIMPASGTGTVTIMGTAKGVG